MSMAPGNSAALDRMHPAFMSGGGETGALIRGIDWSKTSLGSPASWPGALKTTLSIMLHSRHPMFLWWGPDLIQFYNDAYMPSFGKGKHPLAMGQRGQECWPEIWPIIGPQIRDVMKHGIPSWHEDQLVPIFRDGEIRDVYWTYGYSPVFDDNQEQIVGTLVVCQETTAKVLNHAEVQRAQRESDAARARLVNLIKSAPAFVCTLTGPHHEFEMVNALYQQLIGGREVLGKTVAEALPEVVPQGFVDLLDRVYRDAETYVGHETKVELARSADGNLQERFVTFVYQPRRGVDGQVAGVDVFGFDVTDGVRTRALAEAAEQRSDFLARASATLSQDLEIDAMMERLVALLVPERFAFASIWFRDADATFRRVVVAPPQAGPVSSREAASNAETLSPQHPVRYAIERGAEALVIDDLPAWMKNVEGAPEDAEVVATRELRRCIIVPIHMSTGIVATLNVSAEGAEPFDPLEVRMMESVGHQLGIALENAHFYDEAKRLRHAAERATLIKDQFLARVSHDLRNPLGSIIGWAALIKGERVDSPRLAHAIEIIERNAKAQVQLIEDLLDVSRITSGKLRLEIVSVQVMAAVEMALDAARLAANTKGVTVIVEVDPDVGSIAVDPDRFHQVLWNLASNAVKFTHKGGTVRVNVERVDSQLQVVFADNGRGIDPKFLPHVFNKFEQADEATSRTGGLGLGLTIVRHIVELHGGTVAVHSDGLGHGARFTVSIPIRASARSSDTAPERRMPAPKVLHGLTLLAVDDEEEAREVVTAILQDAGATVISAGSADEAMACFRANSIDGIVSDVGMPDKDGLTFMRALRAAEGTSQRVPAVALTAFARASDRMKALSAGFTAHVTKPIEPAELVLVIAGLLGRNDPRNGMV